MASIHDAKLEYIAKWRQNSIQHFIAGDYDWVASLILSAGADRIMEIGCGIGYSTLAIASHGIQALSIDTIPEAIEETNKLLLENGVPVTVLGEGTGAVIALKKANIFDDFENLKGLVIKFQVKLILLCNPGGKLETDLTIKEMEMLHWGKYPKAQMKEETIPALHKWAILIAAAKMAKETGCLLMIVDRGGLVNLDDTLNVMEKATAMKGIGRTGREIQPPPEDGIKLDGGEKEMYWGAGLYRPGK